MRRRFSLNLSLIVATAASALIGCADGPAEFTADNPGGYFHQISTEPSEIFRNKVDVSFSEFQLLSIFFEDV